MKKKSGAHHEESGSLRIFGIEGERTAIGRSGVEFRYFVANIVGPTCDMPIQRHDMLAVFGTERVGRHIRRNVHLEAGEHTAQFIVRNGVGGGAFGELDIQLGERGDLLHRDRNSLFLAHL